MDWWNLAQVSISSVSVERLSSQPLVCVYSGTHADGATTPTTLSYKFNGTTFVVFGSVVDGSAGSTMALNVKIDDDLTSPAYQPKNVTDGVDPSYQLYTNTSLASTTHTFTVSDRRYRLFGRMFLINCIIVGNYRGNLPVSCTYFPPGRLTFMKGQLTLFR